MRWCDVCGHVYDEFDSARDYITCEICGATLNEDDMTAIKYSELSESEKDQYDEQLLNKIKNSPFFQENLFQEYNSLENGEFWCGFRIDKWEKLYTIQKHIDNVKRWRKENEPFKPFEPIDRKEAIESTRSTVEWKMKHQENSRNNNTPHCPICQSTNLSKISNVKKATKVGLFGLLGAGDIGKTWKCNNCGSRF